MGELNVEINGMKVLQGRIPDVSLKEFINPKLLEQMSKRLEEPEIIQMSIIIGKDDERRLITLSHYQPKDAEDKIVTIDVAEDKDIDDFLNIIKCLKEE